MNFNDLIEECFAQTGCLDTGNRTDVRRQKVKDSLNVALDIVANNPPFLWNLVRESTLTIVAGTSEYFLDDWCARPLQIWTADTAAHKVRFNSYRDSTRDGSRGTSATQGALGPWDVTWAPRNRDAVVSGASGSGEGATVTEGSTSVSFGTSGTVLTSALIGKMLRLNGEDADYRLTAVGGSHACTVDRAIRSRVTGLGTSGTGAGYTNVRWEISPPGRYKLNFKPTPSVAATVYYAFIALPRVLINADETPEILRERHHLLWKGALKEIANFNEDGPSWERWAQEFEAAREELRGADTDDYDSTDGAHYSSLLENESMISRVPNSVLPPRRGYY